MKVLIDHCGHQVLHSIYIFQTSDIQSICFVARQIPESILWGSMVHGAFSLVVHEHSWVYISPCPTYTHCIFVKCMYVYWLTDLDSLLLYFPIMRSVCYRCPLWRQSSWLFWNVSQTFFQNITFTIPLLEGLTARNASRNFTAYCYQQSFKFVIIIVLKTYRSLL